MRKEVRTLLRADFAQPAGRRRRRAAAPRRHADSAEGAVRAGAPRRRRAVRWRRRATRRPASAGSTRSGASRRWRAGSPHMPPQLAEFLGDTDPEVRAQAAKMIGDVRYARRRRSPRAAARRCGAARAVLRRRSPRPHRLQAGRERAGRACSSQNDDRDVYLRHAGSLALASIGDAGGARGAGAARVARRCAWPRSSRCAACGTRASPASSPTRTKWSSSKRRAP